MLIKGNYVVGEAAITDRDEMENWYQSEGEILRTESNTL